MPKYDGPAFFRKNGKGTDKKKLNTDINKSADSGMNLNKSKFEPAFNSEQFKKFKNNVDESKINHRHQTEFETKKPIPSSESPRQIDNEPEPVAEPTPKRTLSVKRNRLIKRSAPVFNNEQSTETKSNIESRPVPVQQHHHRNLSDFEKAPETTPTVVNSESRELGYQFPPLSLLPDPVLNSDNTDDWVQDQVQRLSDALEDFDVDANVVDWTVGPTVTQFEVELGRGVKVNKITNLADDLKLQLAAKDIRIEAPIPGKSTVGIEVPNYKSRPVLLSEVLHSEVFQNSESPLSIALGVDLFGEPRVYDLRKMPHGLIAGATGSGKSVFINSLLISLLYKATPRDLRLLLIDPKAVELAPYNELPHLLAPVISDPKAASASLKWVTKEMDNRYDRLAAAGARNIEQYNKKAVESGHEADKMPYIVVIIDELADLMMVASSEVQDYIVRITQKARAAGIHLIIATQRPSVDVVTGLIKNNIPTRVAFMVSSQIDSRTILDHAGAERLLGRGDMLFLGNGQSNPTRIQGSYIEDEIDQITDFVRGEEAPHYLFDPTELKESAIQMDQEDELMGDVLKYLSGEDTISTSKLQRMFSIGYNRAATMIDSLESQGYISGMNGSKPRDVYYSGNEDSDSTDL